MTVLENQARYFGNSPTCPFFNLIFIHFSNILQTSRFILHCTKQLSCCHGGFFAGPEKFMIFFNLLVFYLPVVLSLTGTVFLFFFPCSHFFLFLFPTFYLKFIYLYILDYSVLNYLIFVVCHFLCLFPSIMYNLDI